MKYAALALLLSASCGILVTPGDLDYAIQQNAHEDQTFAAQEDAKIVAALRAEDVPVTNWQPSKAVPPPPTRQPGTDWGEIVVLALTALGGSAGALGYRALDHRRKARKGSAA
jgi:hypothetical protein